MMYVFLDEIQNVPCYEKVVDSLYVKENIDTYIVRSTKHPITHLNSQYIEIHVLPLSFKEAYKPGTDKEEAFKKYMRIGGFPYINQIQLDNEQIDMYLEGIYNTVLVKDIEALCESYLSKKVIHHVAVNNLFIFQTHLKRTCPFLKIILSIK